MKLKMAAVALACCVTFMCSESNADLLGRMLGRGGCGGCQSVSSCCDTPAPVCGGRNFGISININIGMPGRLFRGNNCGGGCGLSNGGLFNGRGCNANVGCDNGCAPAPVMANMGDCGCGDQANSCGCGGRLRGILSGIRSRLSDIGNCGGGCGMAGNDCGCAPVQPAPCGPTCGDTGCGMGGLFQGGLLGRLRGGLSGDCGCGMSMGDCGCQTAPAPSACGCEDTCGSGCGLNLNLRGRVSGLLSRLKPSCGGCGSRSYFDQCGTAPVDCGGCNDSCGGGCGILGKVKGLGQGVTSRVFGRLGSCGGSCGQSACDTGCGSRLSLMSRLRGDRTVRNSCVTGCQPVCPNSGCGGACNSCTSGVQGGMMAQPMQSAPVMQAVPTMAPQANPLPQAVPAETNGAIQVPAPTTPDTSYRQPVVDPSAFIVRGR